MEIAISLESLNNTSFNPKCSTADYYTAPYQKSSPIRNFTTELHIKMIFVTRPQFSQTSVSQPRIWHSISQNTSQHFALFRILFKSFLLEYDAIKLDLLNLIQILVWVPHKNFPHLQRFQLVTTQFALKIFSSKSEEWKLKLIAFSFLRSSLNFL